MFLFDEFRCPRANVPWPRQARLREQDALLAAQAVRLEALEAARAAPAAPMAAPAAVAMEPLVAVTAKEPQVGKGQSESRRRQVLVFGSIYQGPFCGHPIFHNSQVKAEVKEVKPVKEKPEARESWVWSFSAVRLGSSGLVLFAGHENARQS